MTLSHFSTLEQCKPEIRQLLAKQGFYFGSLLPLDEFLMNKQNGSAISLDVTFFEEWLQNNYHAGMDFLKTNLHVRQNPEFILPDVKSALMFIVPYAVGDRVRRRIASHQEQDDHNDVEKSKSSKGILKLIARYARGRDYHRVLKKRLTQVTQDLLSQTLLKSEFRVVVDSVPFLERSYAREAGLGFIGKNTMLIKPGIGSYFFIASVLSSLSVREWDPILFSSNHTQHNKNPLSSLDCGDCRKCLDACPTQAFPEPYVLNANRCLSYLSIEHRGVIEDEFVPHFSQTLFGCDICQTVCPYNFVTDDLVMMNEFRRPKETFLKLTTFEIALMDEKKYIEWFQGTSLTRSKYQGLVRNALYHLFATNDLENLQRVLNQRIDEENNSIRLVLEQLKGLLEKRA